ncbi:MAG: hypothetical protein HKN23_06290, partial [Verrucomicrobiales bacterium]|nr:hypothetical protein [Verrucomicrobiales bacterium]
MAIRFLARIIDFAASALLTALIALPFWFLARPIAMESGGITFLRAVWLAGFGVALLLVPLLYEIFGLSRAGATWG